MTPHTPEAAVSTDSPDLLRTRYGTGRSAHRFGPRGWAGLAVLGTLLAAAVAVWILSAQQREPTFQDVSFEVLSEARATADFELTKRPDDVVTCAVRALNEDFAVVGWTEVTIGAVPAERLGEGGTSSHRVALRTTNLATTAGVESCRLER
ncbi:DUF4307 domain-containing protein [Kocuria sp. M1R5S2]|uniref:DUF4307 domain-containing protein n=1 Tax=Kocuria rhizosphaerae TaxID=3376285 RepID=UPI0037A5A287